MTREKFEGLVAATLASLPAKYRARLENVVVLVEDFPAEQGPPEDVDDQEDLLLGEFIGVPRTERALWDMPPEPARVVLYQRNIEVYCARDVSCIREELRLTLLHELGHFFGMDESQLEDV